MSGVHMWGQLAGLTLHVGPAVELFLLSSPLHTLHLDGAHGGGLPWPCVDEVALQPSSSGWDQEGHLTRLSLLLCIGTERGRWSQGWHCWALEPGLVLLGTGAGGPKEVRQEVALHLPKVTLHTATREGGIQAWQGKENGAEQGAELEAGEWQKRQQRPRRPTRCPSLQLGLGKGPMSLGETRLCVDFCSS